MMVLVDQESKVFQPITLTIVIETEEEFCNLFLRLNQSQVLINEQNSILKHKADDSADPIFDQLRPLINKNNLRNV